MSNKKAAAIAEILKMRDQLVVMRERLFQLTAATAARTKKVDGLLMIARPPAACSGRGSVCQIGTTCSPCRALSSLIRLTKN